MQRRQRKQRALFKLIGGMMAASALFGCAGTKAIDTTSPIPSMGHCAPVTYRKIAASATSRPDWTLNVPPDKEGRHFLIGLSGDHATEQEGRREAMRHARAEFAQYIGVQVAELDEYASAIYGKASDILDPTVSGKSQSSQETNELVSRVKPKEWYFETLQGICQGRGIGVAYQYWVLADVPVEEYEKVQAEKEKRKIKKEAELSKEEERIGNEMKGLAASHQAALTEAEELLSKGDPIAALAVLQVDWSRLYDVGRGLQAKGDRTGGIERVNAMQRDIPARVGRIRSALLVDPGRGGVWISEGEEGIIEIPAWVWYQQEGQVFPLSGVPLLLEGIEGPVARGKSDPDGRVAFSVHGMIPGQYEIAIDPQAFPLVYVREVMAKGSATLSVSAYTPDMTGAARAATQQLFAGSSRKPLPATHVVMGSVRYGETRLGSEFGKRMESLIESEIVKVPQVILIRRQATRGLDTLEKTDKTRSIGMADRRMMPQIIPMNSPAMQAELDGAEAALEANFVLEGEKVVINLKLVQSTTGRIVSASHAVIHRGLIPGDLQLLPPSTPDSLVSSAVSAPGDLHLELTTQRADGATFAEGEKMEYYLSANRDAYLLLLYEDAARHLIQLYPNDRSGNGFQEGGDYIKIPNEAASYDFTVMSPFGVEQVFAFAATSPFPPLSGRGLASGLKVLEQTLPEVAAQLRAHGRRQGVAYGEANVVVTTVKE